MNERFPSSRNGEGFNSAELGQEKKHLKDNTPEMFLKPVLLIEMRKSEKPSWLILLPEEN